MVLNSGQNEKNGILYQWFVGIASVEIIRDSLIL